MALKITFKAKRGSEGLTKKFPEQLEVKTDEVALTLFEYVAKHSNLSQDRVRLTVKSEKPASGEQLKDKVLVPNDLLKDLADKGSLTVYCRDLGPQIAWRTVFLIEYLGPIMVHPIFFNLREQIYGSSERPTLIQTIVYFCVMMHFFKREFETAYIHKFSMATMPLFNLFKNSSHYWLLSGFLVAYFGYAPSSWWSGDVSSVKKFLFYSGGFVHKPELVLALPAAWLVAEISNFIVHVNLASLRPAGTTERRIPYGYGFKKLSCPNYYFEACGWILLTVLSGNWAMALFTIVGTTQMFAWAIKKHRRYLREFPDYPKNRKAMIPFIA